MAVNKTSSGTWRVFVDLGRGNDGKRKRKTGTFKTKREAQIAERQWSELARTNAIVRDSITLESFINDIYLPAKKDKIRYTTFRRYLGDIKIRILPALGLKKLDEISHTDVQRLIDNCETHKVADTTRATLRQILNMAIDMSYVTTNVAAQTYDLPRKTVHPDEHNGDWLTSFSQHEDFLKHIDNETFLVAARLGLGLGLRKGEIFGLDWEDVDLEKRLVHVQRTYVREYDGHKLLSPKTYESDRFIPIHKDLWVFLQDLYEKRGRPTGAVAISKTGLRASPRKTAESWGKWLRAHPELPQILFLNMRHSFATACLNAGIDVTKVSKLLGHTSIMTTVKRYVRFKPEDLLGDFDNLI